MSPTPRRKTRVGKEEEAAVSSEAEENKVLVRRFLEAQSKGDLNMIDELLAPNFVNHSLLPGQDPSREGYLRTIAEDHAALSDIRTTIEYQATDGDDMVITRHTPHGIHDRGELLGMEPSGREWKLTHIDIHRISGGKIVEEWSASGAGPFLEVLAQEIRERERIEQELRVARRIQQASLPREVPEPEGWQITPHYRPAREVGGDFYDFLKLPDEHLGLVVGDATSKGVPAALVMAAARSMLRALAQSSDSPGEILVRVNDALRSDIPSGMFVTCFYGILDPKSGRLVYANAGHNLPCCRRHDGQADELRARGMPLGLMPRMDYEEKETTLETGDSTLFYSDGLVEAHDPKGEMFGFPRLRALVAEHGEEGSLGNILLEELYSFVGEGWEQEDDITLLTLRRSAP
jgi:serine phosphatase RsbU (regulator of sigma subunit)/predicted ester cyclase